MIRRSGRGIRRIITLCGTVNQLVAEYDRQSLKSKNRDDGGDDDEDSDDEVVGGGEALTPEGKAEMKRCAGSRDV